MTCRKCGYQQEKNFSVCPVCGEVSKSEQKEQKSKLVAGLLGIFLGGLGIHNFYLGFTGKAVIQLVLAIFGCGVSSIWGLVEGIMILTGNIDKDSEGIPLKE